MKRILRPRTCRPYPELFEPERGEGPYRIEDSNGRPLPSRGLVNKVERWMFVPLDPWGRPVARHEGGHVRDSPPNLPRVRYDLRILHAVEDARINLGLDWREIPVELDPVALANVRKLAAEDEQRGDLFALVIRSVASIGTNAEADLADLLTLYESQGTFVQGQVDRVRKGLERSRARARKPVAPFGAALRLARKLARELRRAGLLEADGSSSSPMGTGCCIGHGLIDDDEEGGDGGGQLAEAGVAGELHVTRAPLTVSLRGGRLAGRGLGARREGSIIRYAHRWPSDRAIFRGRRRRSSATVLVDVSGSMSLSADSLDRLLLATPAGALVAIYSGRGTEGELRIVASGTRRAGPKHLKPFARGNIVDVPALEWLARQPEPRLWVSDGAVTGVGDHASDAIEERCTAIVKKGRIERIANLEGTVRRLVDARARRTDVPAVTRQHHRAALRARAARLARKAADADS